MNHWNKINIHAWRQLLGFILETRGVDHSVYKRRYVDDVVEIYYRGQSNGIEVERRENRNPVLIYDREGACIRTHGEFIYIRDHLLGLVASIVEEGKSGTA